MPTRVTSKAIVQLSLVRILANGRAHELPSSGRRFQALHTANDVFGQVIEVGLAPGQEIGSRFSEQVLHAIGDEPSANDGEGEAKQAGMELPQLALPDQRLWCPNRDRRAGNENEADDGDDDDGAENADDDEQPDGDCLLDREGKATEAVSAVPIREMQDEEEQGVDIRNVAVVERERPLVWSNVAQNISDGGKGNENDPVENVGQRHDPRDPAFPPHIASGKLQVVHRWAIFECRRRRE